MFRTDQPTAASSLPVPAPAGTPGYFTGGNPATGLAATVVDADWLNMLQEELANAVTAAGLTLSKTTYTQLTSAIKALSVGRLLNIRSITSSGTYSKSPGTQAIYYQIVGAGAGGGGAPACGAGQASVGAPGSAGANAEGFLTSGFDGTPIVIGAAGTGGIGVAGSPGGTTTAFGTTCPGGVGGGVAGPTTPPYVVGTSASSLATGGTLLNAAGAAGLPSIALNSTGGYGGFGGSSPFGTGGGVSTTSTNGQGATGYGAGGGGTNQSAGGGALQGGPGTQGYVLIFEFGVI